MTEEVQDVQEQPRLSLQRRLGVVLSRDDHVSSDEIRQLIAEVTNASAEAHIAAQEFKAASLDLECEDPLAADNAQKALMLERTRLEATKPRLEAKLAAVVRRENRDRWMADRNRVAASRDEAAKNFRSVRGIFDELVAIFRETAEVDAEVQRVNASNPTGGEPLQTVELHARGLERFTRDMPSLAEVTTLFDWKNSDKQIWPPKPVPFGVLMAAAMAPVHDPRYTDRWHEVLADRRAEQEAEQQRTAKYYEDQQREKEQREQHEQALAAAERSRTGY